MHSEAIERVLDHASQNNWELIMRQAQSKYDIRPYKIENLSPAEVKSLYFNVLTKYHKKDIRLSSTYWQQNERRIFIWFVVFYCHLNHKQPNQIVQYSVTQKQSEWKILSLAFFNKNPDFLEFHCKNIVKLKSRPLWTQKEDQILVQTIQNYPIGKWNEVAKEIFFKTNKTVFRTPKQCRERWYNHLDISKDRSQWTQHEDTIIITFVNQYGKKWAQIVKKLNYKRTEHMIKNRYNSLLRKFKKYKNQSQKQIFRMMVETMCINNQISAPSNKLDSEQQIQSPIKPTNKGFELYIERDSQQPKSSFNNMNEQLYGQFFNFNIQMYYHWVHQMMNIGHTLAQIQINNHQMNE